MPRREKKQLPMRPLTERMVMVLAALEQWRRQRSAYGMTPTYIAWACGFRTGPHRSGGLWSGHQSPAQHVTFAITALRERGLVGWGQRSDGLSGMAYFITEAGRAALKEAKGLT